MPMLVIKCATTPSATKMNQEKQQHKKTGMLAIIAAFLLIPSLLFSVRSTCGNGRSQIREDEEQFLMCSGEAQWQISR